MNEGEKGNQESRNQQQSGYSSFNKEFRAENISTNNQLATFEGLNYVITIIYKYLTI